MSTAQNSSNTRQTRLRASCDGCFLAKVKCSKDRPTCSRCLVCGADCKYSQSSRAGKPRLGGSKGRQFSPQKNISIPEESNTSTLAYIQSMRTGGKNSASYRPETDWSKTAGPTGGQSNRNSESSNMIPMLVDESSSEAGSTGADAEILDASFLWTNTPRIDMNSPFTDDILLSRPKPVVNNSVSPSFAPWFDNQADYTGFNSTPGPAPNVYTYNSMMKSPSCNCFNACLQALHALHNSSDPTNPVPRFDVVLTVNRKAVEGCAMMLNCLICVSKSGYSTTTMLLGTIIAKIMSFYQDASKNHFGFIPGPGNQNQPLPLTFGTYRVADEDGRWLEMEILLRELKKLEELFAKFQETTRTSEWKQDEAVHTAVTNYLAQSLHLTFEVLNMQKNNTHGSHS